MGLLFPLLRGSRNVNTEHALITIDGRNKIVKLQLNSQLHVHSKSILLI